MLKNWRYEGAVVVELEARRKLYQLQSDLCHGLCAHPKRLEIIDLLKEGEKSVSQLSSITGYSKANVSQHLTALRRVKIVEARREGASAFYRIINPKLIEACNTIQRVLLDQLLKDEKASRSIRESTTG